MIGRNAFNRRADGQADHRVLGNRRIQNAAGKFLRQIFRGLERAAERADILPVNEHARVVAQRVGLRFADGVNVGDFSSHFLRASRSSVRMKSRDQFSANGSGAGSRWTCATASSISRTISLRQICERRGVRPFLAQQKFLGNFQAIASDAENFSISDQRNSASSCSPWPQRRSNLATTSCGPSPARALATASPTIFKHADKSVPSTEWDFDAVADGLVGKIFAGELARSRRRVGVLIVGDNQNERQFFDGGLVERLVKRAGGSRAVADARRADGAGNFFEDGARTRLR